MNNNQFNKLLLVILVAVNSLMCSSSAEDIHVKNDRKLPNDYFAGAINIKFLESEKEIGDKNYIWNILKHFDLSEKRKPYVAIIPIYIEATLRNKKKVLIGFNSKGWWFKDEHSVGIRYIKDPIAFEKLDSELWEKYGPLSK